MKIENISIEKIIPYENNNKFHDATQVERIANSIKEFWFLQPIVIDKNNVIIVGHGRFEWSKKLWLKDLPCVRVENLTDEQIKKYRILDNKLNESAWNIDNLKVELDELENFNIWELEISIDELFPDLMNIDDDEQEIEEDEVPQVKKDAKIIEQGDVIILWNHRLMCWSCTNADHVEQLFDDERADITLTSPPYNVWNGAKLREHITKWHKTTTKSLYNEYEDNEWRKDLLQWSFDLCKIYTQSQFINIQMLWWNKKDLIERLFNNVESFVDVIVRNKHVCPPQMQNNILNNAFEFVFIFDNENNSRSIRFGDFKWNISNYLETKKEKNEYADIHKAVYSLEFVQKILNINSKSKSVYDPFAWTWSTMIACEKLWRKCYSMELDAKYCELIIQRFHNLKPNDEIKCLNRDIDLTVLFDEK